MSTLGGTVVLVLTPSVAPILLGAAFGTSWPAFWVAMIAAVLASATAFVLMRDRPVPIAAALLLWLTIERFAIALISPRLDTESLRALLAYKELFFPFLGLLLAPRVLRTWKDAPREVRLADGLAIAVVVLVGVAFVLSPAPLSDRVIYARRLAILPLVYLVVRLMPWRAKEARTVLAIVVAAGLVTAVVGLLERSVLESLMWRGLVPAAYYYHLSDLAGLSAPGTDFPIQGLPVLFYDFTTGLPERRLVSTFLEATTLAPFLAIAAIIGLAAFRLRPFVVVIAGLTAAAALLTLSKTGWAILIAGIGYAVVARAFPRLRQPAWLVSMSAGIIGALIVITLALEAASGEPTGVLAHFEGLKQGLQSALIAPFGLGLGMGGNFAASTVGAESTFGVTLVQVGFPGLFVWVAWLLAIALLCTSIGQDVPRIGIVASTLAVTLVAFLATAALTESAGGLLGNWLYPFVAAMIITAAVGARRDRHVDETT